MRTIFRSLPKVSFFAGRNFISRLLLIEKLTKPDFKILRVEFVSSEQYIKITSQDQYQNVLYVTCPEVRAGHCCLYFDEGSWILLQYPKKFTGSIVKPLRAATLSLMRGEEKIMDLFVPGLEETPMSSLERRS